MGIIYDVSADKKKRYSLGVTKTLFCIGINPSTATPDNYDQTMKIFKNISKRNGYDSWLMLNIYPQIATDPNELDRDLDINIHSKNMETINGYIKDNSDVLCCWGSLINKRSYLKKCLIDIYKLVLKKYNLNYKQITQKTDGNPEHLLYHHIENLYEFNLDDYIKNIDH